MCPNSGDARTAFSTFQDRHVNIENLTYSSLGIVIKAIVLTLRQSQQRRYTRSELKSLIVAAANAGNIDVDRLSPSIALTCGL